MWIANLAGREQTMNTMPILMLLLIVALAIYPANKSWGYVTGGSIGVLFIIGWLMVMLKL